VLANLTAPFRNPIFEREFIALCRTRRWFVLRTLLVLFLTLATWVVLSTKFYNVERLDETGKILFAVATVVQIGFVFFLASGLCSDLIVSERRKETLDIILTTPLRPISIVLGKFLSRVGLIVVIVAASFPLVSVSLLYGGVSGRQILGLLEVTLGTILMTAGPALLISVYARRVGTAAVLSQMFPVAWCLTSPVLIWLITRDGNLTAEILTVTHPLMAAIELGEALPFLKRTTGIYPSTGFFLFGAAIAAVSVALSVLRLRRERRGDTVRGGSAPAAVEPRPSDAEAVRARIRERLQGIRETSAPRRKPRAAPVGERRSRRSRIRVGSLRNPMLWKEINLINASTSRALFWIVFLLLAGAEALVLIAADSQDLADEWGIHLTLGCCMAFVLLLLTVVNAATSIVSEREQGTLELIHVTPITIRQILNGKAAGVVRSVALLALIPVLHMAGAAVFTELTLGAFFAFVVTFALLVLYFTTAGLRHSILADRPARAIFRALVHFAALMIGYPVLLGVIGVMGMFREGLTEMLILQPMGFIVGSTGIVQEGPEGTPELLPWLIVAFVLYSGVTVVRNRTMADLYRKRILGRHGPASTAGRVQ